MMPEKLFCCGYFPHASAGLRGVPASITSAVMHPFSLSCGAVLLEMVISHELCCQHHLLLVEADEDISFSALQMLPQG